MALDAKLISADKMKETIFDTMSTLPPTITEWILKGLSELFKFFPFIGSLIAGFLGYTDGAEALV